MLIRNWRKLLWRKRSRDPFFSRQVCLSNREEWQERHVKLKDLFFCFHLTSLCIRVVACWQRLKIQVQMKTKASWKECFLEVLADAIAPHIFRDADAVQRIIEPAMIYHIHPTWQIKVAILLQKKTANLSLFVKFQWLTSCQNAGNS